MSGAADERPRFCPYCGEPVGWFFGRFDATGAVWCDRCQEWFRAERADEAGTPEPGPAFADNDDPRGGLTPPERGETP